MKTLEILKSLTESSGISGDEQEVAELVRKFFSQNADKAYLDKFKNVIGYKKGITSEGKIMFASHIDQIGMMVNKIDKNGFIYFVPIGGHDPRVLVGQNVLIFGKEKIKGVIGSTPPHLQKKEDQNKVTPIENLYIDTGLKKEFVEKNVSVGDTIVFDTAGAELQNNNMASQAMDNRAGVVVLVETLNELTKMKHNWDVFMVGTSQEEVGVRGVSTCTYEIKPDVGVVIDVTFGYSPGAKKHKVYKLNKGGTIASGPNFHPFLTKKLKEIANEWEIPFQSSFAARPGGTDAYSMQISGEGVPVVQMGIPLRYMHTTVETLNIKDIKRMAKILAIFVSNVDDFYKEVKH
ncbi:MAG: M42 family metallopeptidase [Candidatus Mcinerneyibacterium aminivorans]|uniref:M42 family metallopeptidase n=1 Tax=Candidatus Mcinerneyibacterium aminivorans TaxID=2703815 RepID=A0A5D0ML27_9BACT|nr:MAG: M42 family metallopeptidase [Candidatus Mcinerneyibacterium aminivorans]